MTDEELFAAWRGGESQAGDAFLRRQFPAVRRFFASKVGAEVEELVQTTLTRLVESKERFEGRSTPRAWVLGIARNVLREHYRRRMRSDDDIDSQSVADLGSGPSTMRWRKLEDERLLDCLRRLPLHMQTVLELYYWDQLAGREIADVLEIAEGTVASRLRRAKLRLRALFEGTAVPAEDDDAATSASASSGDPTLDEWAERVRAAID